MPLYEYTCQQCEEVFDMYFPLQEWDGTPKCPACGGYGKKNITVGGIKEDSPAWLDDPILQENLQGAGQKPIKTRTELKRYMKDNNLQQG